MLKSANTLVYLDHRWKWSPNQKTASLGNTPMCILAILYNTIPGHPVLVAANRDEAYDRPSSPPSIQSGKPRILAGIDQQHGGTWLGVNQHGMFVGASNRPRYYIPPSLRSRGLLCRDLLRTNSARQAVDLAMDELSSNSYDGVNYLCADAESGWVVHGGDDLNVVELEPGLNIIANGDVNDPRDERVALARRLLTLQTLDSHVKFLAVASKVFARPPSGPGRAGMVMRGEKRGTVSSSLIALGKKPRDAFYQFSNGAPDKVGFEDCSPMLRDILSRGLREARTKAKA